MSQVTRYYNALLVQEQDLVEGELFVQDGKIVAPSSKASFHYDVKGALLSPGFIDIQLNGGFGVDFVTNPEKWPLVAKMLPQTGVTSFVATLVSQSLESYSTLLQHFATNTSDGATCLGVHLEGPWIACSGAHDEKHLQQVCDRTVFEKIKNRHVVKMVTLAPELDGAFDFITYLSKQNICVAAGHTKSSKDQLDKARDCGLQMITHLFNVMEPLHHRKPGPIGYVLGDKKLSYSLIADLQHVDPSTLRLTWNAYKEGMCLVSDASSALMSSQRQHTLGNFPIEVKDQRSVMKGSDRLAGGICPLNKMVKNLIQETNATIPEAIRCVTSKPAELLHLQGQKGSLQIGRDADFVILQPDTFAVIATFVQGKKRA